MTCFLFQYSKNKLGSTTYPRHCFKLKTYHPVDFASECIHSIPVKLVRQVAVCLVPRCEHPALQYNPRRGGILLIAV